MQLMGLVTALIAELFTYFPLSVPLLGFGLTAFGGVKDLCS
jgi:hypothetical protein